MDSIETRAAQAQQLWQQGDTALAAGDHAAAYRAYTQAHDLITDCARLHVQSHVKLRQVTGLRADPREFYTDTLLLWLAPFGLFEFIAWYLRSSVGRSAHCRRTASAGA